MLRSSATEQNPDVQRLGAELRALRSRAVAHRVVAAARSASGSAVDIPVDRLPGAAIDYVRARRELKLQETLLESMVRQFEIAKLDEAKEGPVLQQVDVALPPDRKSKPSRALIVLGSMLARSCWSSAWVSCWPALRCSDPPRAPIRTATTALERCARAACAAGGR